MSDLNLISALRRNPTIDMTGDDICGMAANEIERLRKALQTAIDLLGETETMDGCYIERLEEVLNNGS